MSSGGSVNLFAKYLVVGLVALQAAVVGLSPAQAALPLQDAEGRDLPTLAPMLKRVNPAVVNISTYSTRTQAQNPLLNDPFFRRFFNIPEGQYPQQLPQKRQQSAGSGVIVDAGDGIVMTNFHVIKGADEVQVSLIDGRTFVAEIKGTDADLDIAVLQIEAEDLAQVTMADSAKLAVGDFVVAIGNPFGLGQTVTTGIVSALGRSGLGIEGYENFIQTDASINPGNSGGALVDLNGHLVGINTAIIAPAGGNVGIGFAIPINMAQASMAQILEHGEVRRGQLGIGIQDITEDLRQAFNLDNGQRGVLVTEVQKDSPAEQAGLKAGDVIVAVDGKPTRSSGELRSQISVHSVGERVTLGLLRDGRERKVRVEVGEPASLVAANGKLHPLLEGVTVSDRDDGRGVEVSAIAPNSNAAYSGLRPGDVIVAANKRRVTDVASFAAALALSRDSILLQINRGGRGIFLVIR